MNRHAISTAAAPRAIGAYSQAIRAGNLIFLSGQIPLDPFSMELVSPEIEPQIEQVFRNLAAVAHAAGLTLNAAVKLTVYLTDLGHFPLVNAEMSRVFSEPFPARATVHTGRLAGPEYGVEIKVIAAQA